jgi:hypothetical protein
MRHHVSVSKKPCYRSCPGPYRNRDGDTQWLKGKLRVISMQSTLPIYHTSLDWDAFFAEYPVPDVFERTVYRWPRDKLRAFQNRRFMRLVEIGWKN